MKIMSALREKKKGAEKYPERFFFQGEMQFLLLLPGKMGRQGAIQLNTRKGLSRVSVRILKTKKVENKMS